MLWTILVFCECFFFGGGFSGSCNHKGGVFNISKKSFSLLTTFGLLPFFFPSSFLWGFCAYYLLKKLTLHSDKFVNCKKIWFELAFLESLTLSFNLWESWKTMKNCCNLFLSYTYCIPVLMEFYACRVEQCRMSLFL